VVETATAAAAVHGAAQAGAGMTTAPAIRLRQLLSQQGGEIEGSKLQTVYRGCYGEPIRIPEGKKLKDVLSQPPFDSVCRLEQRAMPKGPALMWVHGVQQGNDLAGSARAPVVETATAAAAVHGAAQAGAGYTKFDAPGRSDGTWQYVGPDMSQATVSEAGSRVGSRVDPGGRSLSNVVPDWMVSGSNQTTSNTLPVPHLAPPPGFKGSMPHNEQATPQTADTSLSVGSQQGCSEVGASLPGAGYRCKYCGQQGGTAAAHWHQTCPRVATRILKVTGYGPGTTKEVLHSLFDEYCSVEAVFMKVNSTPCSHR